MAKRIKKPPLNTLTPEEYEKRLKKIILAGLGKAWMFWPPKAEVKRRCKDPNKPGWSICETCHGSVEKIEVDHIEPCVSPVVGLISWDEYIKRRFVFSTDKLQGLCHRCHVVKTREENKLRRCKHKRTWFDRTITEGSEGSYEGMHTVCSDCGKNLG